MSILVIATTPGLDAAGYEEIFVGSGGGVLPAGCSAHHAGPVEGGWRVVSVWDSAESARAFMGANVVPALAEKGLQPNPPEITELHLTLT